MKYETRERVIESLKGGNNDFRWCDLRGLDLSGLILCGVKFTGADLGGANLNSANLRRCVGDGKRIKNIDGLQWKITYTKDFLQIGCKGHLIDEWRGFDDNTISQMNPFALDFWMTNKTKIFNRIKNNPAE